MIRDKNQLRLDVRFYRVGVAGFPDIKVQASTPAAARCVVRRKGCSGAFVAIGAGIEMHDLPTPMHTGVGTPGADHRDGLVGHFRQGLLQCLLDTGHTAGLALPAAVARTLVFHAQGNAGEAFGGRFGGSGVDDVQERETCGAIRSAGDYNDNGSLVGLPLVLRCR
jgi:hypothetical protein